MGKVEPTAMDILSHIDELEQFSLRLGEASRQAAERIGASAVPANLTSRAEAMKMLERLGIVPRAIRPQQRQPDLPMPSPDLTLLSLQTDQLEASLCALPDLEAMYALLEEGERTGAFTIAGDRISICVYDEEGANLSPSTLFDITKVVERSAMALKAAEARDILQRMSVVSGVSAQSDEADEGKPRPLAAPGTQSGPLPTFVRVRGQEAGKDPTLKAGPVATKLGIRGRIRELISRHPAIARMTELGPNSIFMVVGAPVRLADGSYVPIEAVESEARAVIMDRLERRRRPEENPVTLARLEEVESLTIPDALRAAPILLDAENESTLPSPARIELAYRLAKGISLSASSGEPLEASTRERLERMLGGSFAHVRLHTGPAASWITHTLKARAITSGANIFVPQETLSDVGGVGERTLAHELMHVKQQMTLSSDSRGRESLEAEARGAEEHVLERSNLSFSNKVVPQSPSPGRLVPDGIFLAEPDDQGNASTRVVRKRVEILAEGAILQLQAALTQEREKAEEDHRDRVF